MRRFIARQYLSLKIKVSVDKPYEYTVNLPRTEFPMKANASQNEQKWRERCTGELYRWQQSQLNRPLFTLHDGPPYANGELHLGHAMNKILKDIIVRSKILSGYRVDFRPGFDCHGLPIELKALQSAGKSLRHRGEYQKGSIDDSLAIENAIKIRETAQRFAADTVQQQKKQFQQWAICADWDRSYLTMDKQYEAAQMEIFSRMWSKGLIYRKYRPVYWSPKSQSALAESELEYVDNHKSLSAYVKFPISSSSSDHQQLSFLVWTTTPWTLLANQALCINSGLEYVIAEDSLSKERLVVAKDLVSCVDQVARDGRRLDILGDIDASSLLGMKYKHPLTDYSGSILDGDFVTDASGTGIVHIAPAHGMEDYQLCQKHGIKPMNLVDNEGKFTQDAGSQYAGLKVLSQGNDLILQNLSTNGNLFTQHDYIHKYPYDWRSKTPVITRATSQWFADVSTLQKDAIKLAENGIKFIPEQSVNRLVAFVSGRSEWCISRQRSWGVPIPAFYFKDSNKELMDQKVIDHVVAVIKDRGCDAWWKLPVSDLLPEEYKHIADQLRKGLDTMDVWFDSGSSWAAVLQGDHKDIPVAQADVVLEGSDQHRGWFQSSLLTSTAVQALSPFKTLISHGFLLDEKGRKQSKSLGNVINPSYITDSGVSSGNKPNLALGVDVLRLWVASADYTNDVSIGQKVIKQTADLGRKYRNTLRFMLSNMYDFSLERVLPDPQLILIDRYMLHKVQWYQEEVLNSYQEYNFAKVIQTLSYFINTELSAGYFDILKDRLYNDAGDSYERRSAQSVLRKILHNLNISMAPITCHLAEESFSHYKNLLEPQSRCESVFQSDLLTYDVDLTSQEQSEIEMLLNIRKSLLQSYQIARDQKVIGAPIQAQVTIAASKQLAKILDRHFDTALELFQCGELHVHQKDVADLLDSVQDGISISVTKSSQRRCIRCWKHNAIANDNLCSRCSAVVENFASISQKESLSQSQMT
ncbi:hypothetical protein MIR68_010127 [Amoeboaphelidium protococcarum]|nr:hypothetical protein MIR68_010127 [Amoeboaphelidium protococcarum]